MAFTHIIHKFILHKFLITLWMDPFLTCVLVYTLDKVSFRFSPKVDTVLCIHSSTTVYIHTTEMLTANFTQLKNDHIQLKIY